MNNMRQCVVRKMQLADVPAIALLTEEFAQYMRELGDTTELQLDAAAIERDGFGPHPAFDGLAAEMDSVVAGYLLYHDGYDTDAANRVLFVVDLFVQQDFRRHKIGEALMQEACKIAKEREAKQLVWTVDKHNMVALQFYERLGGRVVDWLHLMCLDV
jgi:ribosomal protein S18 acetylase RimI-like enzyme